MSYYIPIKVITQKLEFRVKSLKACGLYDEAAQVERDLHDMLQSVVFLAAPVVPQHIMNGIPQKQIQ